jgi:Kef-type K+ transport system membrane component KefB
MHIGVLDAVNNTYGIAALWLALAFVASVISVRVGLAVALVEILLGVLGGNLLGMSSNQWIDFLAGFGSVLLTFLAGAEIEPKSFRRFLTPSLVIGGLGFLAPCALALAFSLLVLHWPPHASEIAGISLSTTSVAVVYAVMLDTGLNKTDLGKLILCACFVCDLGTVLALGIVFADYNAALIAFGITTGIVLVFLPRSLRFVIARIGHPVSEPEVKYVFLLLFGLGALATAARSEAVLPAYVLGLGAAGVFHADPKMVGRVRGIAFTFLTPFFFLRAGTLISIPAVLSGVLVIVVLFAVKVGAKVIGVFPSTRPFHITLREAWYTTMMMSTGLTFGTIAALFGFTNGYIDRSQYSILVTVVVLTALVPTLIAQMVFTPRVTELLHGAPEPEMDPGVLVA